MKDSLKYGNAKADGKFAICALVATKYAYPIAGVALAYANGGGLVPLRNFFQALLQVLLTQ